MVARTRPAGLDIVRSVGGPDFVVHLLLDREIRTTDQFGPFLADGLSNHANNRFVSVGVLGINENDF